MDTVMELLGQFWGTVQPNSIGAIFIYVIFFLSLITLMPMPDGNDNAQYLLFGTEFLEQILH